MKGRGSLGRHLLPPALAVLALAAGGCWDRTDIERRAMVTAVGVDLARGPSAGPDTTEPEPGPVVREIRYKIGIEWPFAPALMMAAAAGEGGGGGGKAPPVLVTQTTATTLEEANRQFNDQIYRIPFYGFTQALLIGEEAARQGIEPVADFFMRSFEANWRMNVYISEGPAVPLLPTRSALGDMTGVYLARIAKGGTYRTARTVPVTFIDLRKALVTPGAILVPRIKPAGRLLKVAGAGVVKEGRLVAWLGETESRAAWLVNGEPRGGELVVASPRNPGQPMTLDIFRVSAKKDVRMEDGRPVFDVRIKVIGRLGEKQDKVDVYHSEEIREREAAAARAVKAQAEAVIKKTQMLGADVFEFHRLLERRFPAEWRRLKEDWPAAYSRSHARVAAEVKLRHVGMTH